jgi:hypothetical protein
MAEAFHFCEAARAGWFLRNLRDNGIFFEDSGVLENLFNPDRIAVCDESVFLTDENKNVLGLALIAIRSPSVWSYYTIPDHRGKGCGYRLLVKCLERIIEQHPDVNLRIFIEPISDESSRHIRKLPPELRGRLLVQE